ncbi:MAG: RdgB/HAM1 family non-canonical purine NTP pyrophosphatase [Candidatus Micrarchaeaceae archaeon]
MEPYFVTSNKHKLAEMRQILGMKMRSANIEVGEIQSIHAEEVALDKAMRAFATLKKPVIVEDTALYINALNGFPGALVKFMELSLGSNGICRLMRQYSDRRATAETCIVLYDGKKIKKFIGSVAGTISNKVRGSSGFGFDTIFIPAGYSRTFAEMGTEEKNKISHRMKAAVMLRSYLATHSSVPKD